MTLYENIGDVGTAICPGVEALKVQKFKVFTSSTSAKKRRAAEVGNRIKKGLPKNSGQLQQK